MSTGQQKAPSSSMSPGQRKVALVAAAALGTLAAFVALACVVSSLHTVREGCVGVYFRFGTVVVLKKKHLSIRAH